MVLRERPAGKRANAQLPLSETVRQPLTRMELHACTLLAQTELLFSTVLNRLRLRPRYWSTAPGDWGPLFYLTLAGAAACLLTILSGCALKPRRSYL